MAFELASLVVKLMANDSVLGAALDRVRDRLADLDADVTGMGSRSLTIGGLPDLAVAMQDLQLSLNSLMLPSAMLDALDKLKAGLAEVKKAFEDAMNAAATAGRAVPPPTATVAPTPPTATVAPTPPTATVAPTPPTATVVPTPPVAIPTAAAAAAAAAAAKAAAVLATGMRGVAGAAGTLGTAMKGLAGINITPRGLSQTSEGFDQLHQHTGTLLDHLSRLAGIDIGTLLQLGTIGGIVAGLGKMVSTAMEVDDGMKMMGIRMEALGFNMDTAMPKFREFVGTLAATGTMSRQVANDMAKMAIMRGPERMRQDYDKLVIAAQAFAAKTGMPIQNMMRMVLLGEENYQSYQRLLKLSGVQVRHGASQAEIMAKVNMIVRQGTEIAAKQSETYQAAVQRLKNSVETLFRTFAVAAAGPLAASLKTITDRINQVVVSITGWVKQNRVMIEGLAKSATQIILMIAGAKAAHLVFMSLISSGGLLHMILGGMLGPIGLMSAAFIALKPVIGDLWKPALAGTIAFVSNAVTGIRAFGAAVYASVRGPLEQIGITVKTVLGQIGVSIGGASGGFGRWGLILGTVVGTALAKVLMAVNLILAAIPPVVEAIKPFLPILLSVAAAALSIGPAFRIIGTVLGPITGAIGFLLSPIGLVVGAVGVLFAIMVESEGSVTAAWNRIYVVVMDVADGVMNFGKALWKALGPTIMPLVGALYGLFSNLMVGIFGVDVATRGWAKTLGEGIGRSLATIVSWITTAVEWLTPWASLIGKVTLGVIALKMAWGFIAPVVGLAKMAVTAFGTALSTAFAISGVGTILAIAGAVMYLSGAFETVGERMVAASAEINRLEALLAHLKRGGEATEEDLRKALNPEEYAKIADAGPATRQSFLHEWIKIRQDMANEFSQGKMQKAMAGIGTALNKVKEDSRWWESGGDIFERRSAVIRDELAKAGMSASQIKTIMAGMNKQTIIGDFFSRDLGPEKIKLIEDAVKAPFVKAQAELAVLKKALEQLQEADDKKKTPGAKTPPALNEWQEKIKKVTQEINNIQKTWADESDKRLEKQMADSKKKMDDLMGGRPNAGGWMDLMGMWKKLQEQVAGGQWKTMEQNTKDMVSLQGNANLKLDQIKDAITGKPGQNGPAGPVPPSDAGGK